MRSASELTSAGWTNLNTLLQCQSKTLILLLPPSALADSPDKQNVRGHTDTHRSEVHTSQNKPSTADIIADRSTT